jgi:hypothetical protein
VSNLRIPAEARQAQHLPPQAVRLSAVVMVHPSRIERARALRARHPELALGIVVDPAPDASPSPLRTAKLAWRAIADDATHHLVVQDDALLPDCFPASLRSAIAAMPEHALCLFTEWGSATSYVVRLATFIDAAWAAVVDHYVPSVALVLPAQVARAFAEAAAAPTPQDDVALRGFLSDVGTKAYIAVPNLVDHLPGPSLTGNDRMGARRSVCYLSDWRGDLAWTTRVIEPRVVPFFSWTRGLPGCLVREDGWGRHWRRTPPDWLLRARGLDTAEVVGLGRVTIAPWLRGDSLAVPPNLVFGLWVTAFEQGVELAGLIDGDLAALDVALARPAVQRALATMPAGALRMFVAAERLAAVQPDLERLIRRGVRQGFEASRTARGGDAADQSSRGGT